MTRLALCLARLCASAWVGAAVLFVVVAVGQVLSRQFSSEVTDRLVALRFPPYYLFGFGLVGARLPGDDSRLAADGKRPPALRW